MAIRGLIAFVQGYPELSLVKDISGRKVLIEFRSFAFWLNSKFSRARYGGEYFRVGQVVKGFIKMLRHHKIEPHVVGLLGDGDDLSQYDIRKYTIAMNSACSGNFENIMATDSTFPHHNDIIWPLLFIDSIIEALEEEEVEVKLVEAKEDVLPYIVHSANSEDRLVLSHRADYLMADLTEGLVSLEQWNLEPDDLINNTLLNRTELRVPVYHIQNFIDRFNIPRSQLPSFATLAGTGMHKPMSPEDLADFHEIICPLAGQKTQIRKKLFLALMTYVSKFKNSGEVLLDAATKAPNTIEPLWEKLEKRLKVFEAWSKEELLVAYPATLARNLKRKYATFNASMFYDGSFCHNVLVGQLEDIDQPYSDGISQSIRITCYEFRKEEDDMFEACEYFRSGTEIEEVPIHTADQVDIPSDRESRKQFIAKLLGLENFPLERFTENEQLFVLSLCFWGENGVHVSKIHLTSMLLCAIYCSATTKQSVIELGVDEAYKQEISEELEQFLQHIDHTRHCYDMRIAHALAQWQCCWRDLKWLNELLAHPFPPTPVHKLYLGSFVYYAAAVQLGGGMIEHIVEIVNPIFQRLEGCVKGFFKDSPSAGDYTFDRAPVQANLCREYEVQVCDNQENCRAIDCKRLHICPKRLVYECFGPPCPLNHEVRSKQPYLVLCYRGMNMSMKVKDIIQRIRELAGIARPRRSAHSTRQSSGESGDTPSDSGYVPRNLGQPRRDSRQQPSLSWQPARDLEQTPKDSRQTPRDTWQSQTDSRHDLPRDTRYMYNSPKDTRQPRRDHQY